eukprot:TRINITY_DN24120_c0_g1_i1.p1 TRINITY_DN24120_c0_g1~~TRINITY_DN24120_c0_g1_i1.p1  ORF type:complete len:911 (+),score=208.43 TRINITY_DN24120_c0_g1_i1:39-2735(+)
MSPLRLLALLYSAHCCVAMEWKAMPFVVSSSDGLQVDARARQALADIAADVEVVSVVEMDNVEASVTNLLWTSYQLEAKIETMPEPFRHDEEAAPVWMLYGGESQRGNQRIILSTNFASCSQMRNATRFAFTMLATVSQALVLDYSPSRNNVECPALLKALAAEADLTQRVVHNPLCAGENCLQDVMLPDLTVFTSEVGVEREIAQILRHETEQEGSKAYKEVNVVVLPTYAWTVKAPSILENSGDKDKRRMREAVDHIDTEVAGTKFQWTTSGLKLVSWVEHVLEARVGVTSIPITYVPTFISKTVHLGFKTAFERYKREMKGVAEYGYVLKDDGTAVIAIAPGHSSLQKAAEKEDASKALTNKDVNMDRAELRPPSQKALKRLHEAAKVRCTEFVQQFLKGIADPTAPVTDLMKKIDAEFERILSQNSESIKTYITSYMNDLYDSQVTILSAKKRDLPLPKAVIDSSLEALIGSAKLDFETILGQLNETKEAMEGRETLVHRLDSLFNSYHKSNKEEVTRKLDKFADDATRHAESKTLDLPLGKAALKRSIDGIEMESLGVWQKLIDGLYLYNGKTNVWPERSQTTEDTKGKLKANLFKLRKDYESLNRIEVQKKCKAHGEKVSSKYKTEVVLGRTIRFPGNEDTVFEQAVAEAVQSVIEFNNSLSEFADTSVFEEELKQVEGKLQELICGDVYGKGQSVMGTNVELLAQLDWVSEAMKATARAIKADGEERAGTIFHEQLSKFGGSQYSELSAATRQKLSNHWCSTELGRDCPGSCDAWAASGLIHAMDVIGFCEPDWTWCNWNSGKETEKGDRWKDTPFYVCSVPISKPCPGFWERRGSPMMKIILRIIWAVSVVGILVSFYSRVTRKHDASEVKKAALATPKESHKKKKSGKH